MILKNQYLLTLISLFFQSYSEAKNLSNKQFIQGPKFSDGTKICFIGDAGTGGSGQLKVAEFLKKENCSSVYYVGDVIYERGLKNHKDKQFTKKFYNPYKSLLEGGVPFHMIIGNHDHDGNVDAWIKLSEIHKGKIIYPHYYYSEIYEDVCFIGIDTDIPLQEDNNSKQQTWTLNALEELKTKGCKLSIAFSHHPYISSGDYGEAEPEIRNFLLQTVLGKTDFYITGHDHLLADEAEEEGTRLLISGGGGQDLYEVTRARPGTFVKSVPGYVTIEITREGDKVNAQYSLVEILNNVRTVIHTNTIAGQGIR